MKSSDLKKLIKECIIEVVTDSRVSSSLKTLKYKLGPYADNLKIGTRNAFLQIGKIEYIIEPSDTGSFSVVKKDRNSSIGANKKLYFNDVSEIVNFFNNEFKNLTEGNEDLSQWNNPAEVDKLIKKLLSAIKAKNFDMVHKIVDQISAQAN